VQMRNGKSAHAINIVIRKKSFAPVHTLNLDVAASVHTSDIPMVNVVIHQDAQAAAVAEAVIVEVDVLPMTSWVKLEALAIKALNVFHLDKRKVRAPPGKYLVMENLQWSKWVRNANLIIHSAAEVLAEAAVVSATALLN